MQLFNTRRRKAIGTAAVCAISGVSALAFAAWLQDATGDGSGKIGSLKSVTVTAGPTTDVTALMPGQTGDVAFTITNPNDGPMEITKVAPAGPAYANPTGLTSPCSASSVTGTWTNTTGEMYKTLSTPVDVPVGESTVILEDFAKLAADANSGCQGQSFTWPLRLSLSTA